MIMVRTKVRLRFLENLMHDYGPHESETQILRDSNARLWSARKWDSIIMHDSGPHESGGTKVKAHDQGMTAFIPFFSLKWA